MYYYRGIALDYHARTLETSKEVHEYCQKKIQECCPCPDWYEDTTESEIYIIPPKTDTECWLQWIFCGLI